MEVIREQNFRVPVHSWLPSWEIESGAMDQIRNVATHPEVDRQVVIMPDCHQGFGVPIGCVMATEGSIIPNAVGVDIGCGVSVARTSLRVPALDLMSDSEHAEQAVYWDAWAREVGKRIPTGFKWFDHRHHSWEGFKTKLKATTLQDAVEEKARVQLGTLGGGNHFLEAAVDQDGYVWLMVHSGSRAIGNIIAKTYHTMAIADSERRGLETDKSLASLLFTDNSGHDYYHDMSWAMDYAKTSRFAMLREMETAMLALGSDISVSYYYDTSHNYAEMYGLGAIHRKGANNLPEGVVGAIPGSMGTASYIVQGLGNPDALDATSHGAGRAMGRNQAKKNLRFENFETDMMNTFTPVTVGWLDESPEAYKSIDTVIERQSDLLVVVHRLQPLRTVKGDVRASDG